MTAYETFKPRFHCSSKYLLNFVVLSFIYNDVVEILRDSVSARSITRANSRCTIAPKVNDYSPLLVSFQVNLMPLPETPQKQ